MNIRKERAATIALCVVLTLCLNAFGVAGALTDNERSLKKQLMDVSKQLGAERRKTAQLAASVQKSRKDLEVLQTKYAALEDERSKLTEKVTSLRSALEEKANELARLESSDKNLQNWLRMLSANTDVEIRYIDGANGQIEKAFDHRGDVMVRIPADPSKGFHFSYFIYVPANIDTSMEKRMLVETNNSGVLGDDLSLYESNARKVIEKYPIRRIAQNIGSPLIMPAFPRPASLYTHDLGKVAMEVNSGDLKRLDLQLTAMIKDAHRILEENGIPIYDKVFLNGFGASGKFASRYAFIHPEMVRAVAAGGSAVPILPLGKFDGTTLTYPIGVADLKELTGEDFNMNELRQVSLFWFLGADDTHDDSLYDDCYAHEHQEILHNVFGPKTQERWNKIQRVVGELGLQMQFGTYKNGEHAYNEAMIQDIIEFFVMNTGSTPTKTKVHE